MTCLSRAALAWIMLCSTALAGDFPANLKLVNLHEPSGFRLDGAAAQDLAGISLSLGGGVNGDGYAHLLIGAIYADDHGTDSGAACVVFAKNPAFPTAFKLSSLDGSNGFRLAGANPQDHTGSVSYAGDVDGDGSADFEILLKNINRVSRLTAADFKL